MCVFVCVCEISQQLLFTNVSMLMHYSMTAEIVPTKHQHISAVSMMPCLHEHFAQRTVVPKYSLTQPLTLL